VTADGCQSFSRREAEARGDEIAAGMECALVLTGETTLPSSWALVSSGFVTNDSGPMHLAAALGVPSWRCSDPRTGGRRRPSGAGHGRPGTGECAPCMLRECPIDHRCMRAVTVEQVARAATELLEGSVAPIVRPQ
jgi:heptosyltransferase-2